MSVSNRLTTKTRNKRSTFIGEERQIINYKALTLTPLLPMPSVTQATTVLARSNAHQSSSRMKIGPNNSLAWHLRLKVDYAC
jgi:hypothetical protein